MEPNSPYVYRDEPSDPVGESSDRDDDWVIVAGRTTTYRSYDASEE